PTTTHCRSPAYVYSSVTRTRRSSRDEGDVSALPAVEDARPGLSAYDETGGAALVRNVTPPGFEGHPRAPARRASPVADGPAALDTAIDQLDDLLGVVRRRHPKAVQRIDPRGQRDARQHPDAVAGQQVGGEQRGVTALPARFGRLVEQRAL